MLQDVPRDRDLGLVMETDSQIEKISSSGNMFA